MECRSGQSTVLRSETKQRPKEAKHITPKAFGESGAILASDSPMAEFDSLRAHSFFARRTAHLEVGPFLHGGRARFDSEVLYQMLLESNSSAG